MDCDPKLTTIAEMALSVLPREIGCDDVFEYFAAYAEHRIQGSELPEWLLIVAEHLDRCQACREEVEFLLAAMKPHEESSS
jgi:hypothetical protein